MRFSFILAIATISFGMFGSVRAATVQSPDGRIKLETSMDDGGVTFEISRDGNPLVEQSPVGFVFDGPQPNWSLAGTKETKGDTTWKPVVGKRAEVRDRYNGLTVSLKNEQVGAIDIEFRLYDDAVAMRTVLGASCKIKSVQGELTKWNFAADPTCWSYAGERPNIGPELLSDANGARRCPMVLKVSDDCYLAINEAAVYDFTWMELATKKGERSVQVTVRPTPVSTAQSFALPWRVLKIGDTPGVLVDSDVLENLNPPCQIEDTSWIKPATSFWDWRAWGYKADDGFVYDLDRPSWERFVNLAAESGVSNLLIDADWYGPEFDNNSDPSTTEKGVPELIKYAKSKGVGVFLYLNDVGAKKYGLETVLKQFADWGAIGVKYGFMREPAGLPKVNHTRNVIKLCAKYKLMVNFHDGPVPPCGDTRTWPNCLTREFCHAQSDAKKAFTPTTFCCQALVNMTTGPLDMNNGMLALNTSCAARPKIFAEVPSTLASEVARTIIIFSGLVVVPDAADSYRKHPEAYAMIEAQQMPWRQSRTLDAEIGQYVVMMRESREGVFLIGATTNEESRTIEVPFDFLGEGKYKAVVLEDAPDAHYLNNREAYQVRKLDVTAGDKLMLKLAPGGGAAVRIEKAE